MPQKIHLVMGHPPKLSDEPHLWPPIVFRNAGSAVREHIIASMQDEGANFNRALFALAWIGDKSIVRCFREWAMHPPSWVAKLHIGPAAYAHVAGWEVTEFGRRNLYYDTCFGVSVAEPEER